MPERETFISGISWDQRWAGQNLGLERAAVTLEYEQRGLHTDFLSGSMRNTTVSIKGIYFVEF